MERYVDRLAHRISEGAWRAKAYSDVPSLPWHGRDGREACSFVLISVEGVEPFVAFLDAHGAEIPDLGAIAPAAEQMLMAFDPPPNEVVFLPAAHAAGQQATRRPARGLVGLWVASRGAS